MIRLGTLSASLPSVCLPEGRDRPLSRRPQNLLPLFRQRLFVAKFWRRSPLLPDRLQEAVITLPEPSAMNPII